MNKLFILYLLFFFGLSNIAVSQSVNDEYWGVITDRSAKIAKSVSEDSVQQHIVTDKLRDFYFMLNSIYELRDFKLKNYQYSSEEKKQLEDYVLSLTGNLSKDFFTYLAQDLTTKQVEMVKNGVTYNVYPNTLKAYQEMIPTLSAEQIKVIDNMLFEAREYAFHAESSKKKHAWFGKYKGRVNNYLSKEGYNLKEEGDKWEERLKNEKK